jgi:transposase InsO family protein
MVNRTFQTRYNRKRIRRVMQRPGLLLAPRVHRRHGRPHRGQVRQPASNQRWCSDVFLIPCWSGEMVSVAFTIDGHDREVPAYVASPRPLTGRDIRTLMDRTLWARFGEATLTDISAGISIRRESHEAQQREGLPADDGLADHRLVCGMGSGPSGRLGAWPVSEQG